MASSCPGAAGHPPTVPGHAFGHRVFTFLRRVFRRLLARRSRAGFGRRRPFPRARHRLEQGPGPRHRRRARARRLFRRRAVRRRPGRRVAHRGTLRQGEPRRTPGVSRVPLRHRGRRLPGAPGRRRVREARRPGSAGQQRRHRPPRARRHPRRRGGFLRRTRAHQCPWSVFPYPVGGSPLARLRDSSCRPHPPFGRLHNLGLGAHRVGQPGRLLHLQGGALHGRPAVGRQAGWGGNSRVRGQTRDHANRHDQRRHR